MKDVVLWAGRVLLAVCVAAAAGCGGSGSGSAARPFQNEVASGESSGVPALGLWESQMLLYGEQLCSFLQESGAAFDPKLAAVYYDAEWVFYQIGDYTGDARWYGCSQTAEAVYRDQYVLPNGGNVPGFWIFPLGLARDYLSSGDEQSRAAVSALAHNAAFARDTTGIGETVHVDQSRETAYSIMTYLSAEDVGEPRRLRLSLLVEHALGHLDQWFGSQTAPYVRPFMVGLTAQALIMYYERTGDARVVSGLTRAADWLWDHTWQADAQAFQYTDRGETQPSPDLNLLIAPMYIWLYHRTGQARFLERGDQIFVGGVQFAFLGGGKQFNQNYRWSFEFVRLRSQVGS